MEVIVLEEEVAAVVVAIIVEEAQLAEMEPATGEVAVVGAAILHNPNLHQLLRSKHVLMI